MSNYSVLILDDEIENINLLKIYLKKYCKSIDKIDTATNVEDATNSYLEHKQDILLLDIELGGTTTSFAMLDAIPDVKAEVVFITSHKEYAIQAINSIKTAAYLVKPVKPADLVIAIEKCIKNIVAKDLVQLPKTNNENLIAIPSINKVEIIKIENILYLEAKGRYTILYLKDGSPKMASKNLGEYEKQLENHPFFRIHNSYIVNLTTIVAINKAEGNYCELITGKFLPIAKRRQVELHKLLKIK